MKNGFYSGASARQFRHVRWAMRRKVLSEYKSDLNQATGWRRSWIKWKIAMITEIRFRDILCLGAAVNYPVTTA